MSPVTMRPRFKKKKIRMRGRPIAADGEQKHGFEMPTAPMKREVAIGETITVAELAQRMAVKANEVIKALMGLGVMATINQSIDQDTAVLVIEEMGHEARLVKENEIEEDIQGIGESDEQSKSCRVRRWSRSWVTSTTARPRCSTTSVAPRWPPARPAASPSTSVPTTSRPRVAW